MGVVEGVAAVAKFAAAEDVARQKTSPCKGRRQAEDVAAAAIEGVALIFTSCLNCVPLPVWGRGSWAFELGVTSDA